MIFWIFLVFAVFANALKGFCSKKLSGSADSFVDNLMINTWRCLGCAAFGGVLLLAEGESFALTKPELIICIASGAAMAWFQLSWLISLKNGAYVMVSAFSSASFIVPFVCGVTFLDEKISVFKLIAVALIGVAIFFLCRYNNKTKNKLTFSAFLLLASVCLSQGTSQILQKLYTASVKGSSVEVYIFYTFVFAAVITIIIGGFVVAKQKKTAPHLCTKRTFGLVAASTLGIYGANYFQTAAAEGIDATVMFPILNGLSLCAGTLMSILIFHEKPKPDSIIGVILVFCAIMLNTLFVG